MATVAANCTAPTGSQATNPSMHSHPFTCVTCAIAFRSSELQRSHMRSDWHRYNLKRRVASLPPLSSEIFAEKVLTAQESNKAAAVKAAFNKTCQACQKTYYSENAYRNHLGSQRHKQRVMALESGNQTETASVMSSVISLGEPVEIIAPEHTDDPEVEAEFSKVTDGIKDTRLTEKSPVSRRPSRLHHSSNDDKEEDHPISPSATPASDATKDSTAMPLSRCIFCNYESPSLKLSINHMQRVHGMFIPEQAYLTDLEGLVEYLQAKVTENHECLYCHKLKNSAPAVQTHMRDKGHCMIGFDSEDEMLEIGQFYDFRSTYSDEEEDSDEDSDDTMEEAGPARGGVKLGAARKSEDMDVDEGEGEGWETDSDDDSIDSDNISSLPKDRPSRPNAQRPKHSAPDGFHARAHARNTAFHVDNELYLPSGRTAGHRSLAKYFRQNLRDYPTPEERAQRTITANGEDVNMEDEENKGPVRGRQIVRRGESGMLGVTDQKKRQITAVAQKQQQKAQRQERQAQWRIERRANNQTHFRDDNFGIRL